MIHDPRTTPGARVATVYANDGDVRGRGVVVAWTDLPQTLVRYEDGTQEWWMTRLCRARGRHARPEVPESP